MPRKPSRQRILKLCTYKPCSKQFAGKSTQKYCSVPCRRNQAQLVADNKVLAIAKKCLTCPCCGRPWHDPRY